MGNRTPLYPKHLESNARLVDFGGWDMPLHYGSQVQEHHAVRRAAAMFDVSHMTIVDVAGSEAKPYLRHLLANDVQKLAAPGKALYSCMLNDRGGVVDDLIVYYLSQGRYRMVVNAATRSKDLLWMDQHRQGMDVQMRERDELAMIAVQGPEACRMMLNQLSADRRGPVASLKPFFAADLDELFVSRTGYTGEDGFEAMMTGERAPQFWQALLAEGVTPAGLGARDTLRLEAGMNLYGTDMDETVSPLESALGWTVAWQPAERDFIGRVALENERRTGPARKLVGLVLQAQGVLRSRQRVTLADGGEGEITSGTFSPTLGVGIALARVPARVGASCEVEVRDKRLPAKVVQPPFVRHGKSCLD